MDNNIDELLHKLRQAMYEALASSCDVAEAMAKLEQEGHCPTLLVDVSLANEPLPSLKDEGALVLTDYDQRFISAIKVASPV